MRLITILCLILTSLSVAGCGGPPVPPAVARLAHPDAEERLSAVRELDRTSDPRILKPLLRAALGDPDPRVRQEAAVALEDARGDSLESLALEELSRNRDVLLAGWLLDSRLESVRCGALCVLQSLGTQASWSRLADQMGREPSAGVRMLCARALAQGLSQGAGSSQVHLAEALTRGLQDPEIPIRRICAKALALEGEPRAAGVLVEALQDASKENDAERLELLELLRVATGEDLGQDPGPWISRYGGAGPRRG